MFSPDSKKVIYSGGREWTNDIYMVNVDGTGEKQLTPTDTVDDFSPAFTPNGRKIVFVSAAWRGQTSADLHPQISIMNNYVPPRRS